MFKCENCGQIVSPGIQATRLTLKTRSKRYPQRTKANKFRQSGREHFRDDHGGSGVELVQEIAVCPQCAQELKFRMDLKPKGLGKK